MKRMGAVLLGLMMLVLAPAVVPVPAAAAPVSRDQAVSYVIARGLAHRVVPYPWAGGHIEGPSLGPDTAASIAGFDPPRAVTLYNPTVPPKQERVIR